MRTLDVDNINKLYTEASYRDVENMQPPSSMRFDVTNDRKNSAGIWSSLSDPAKGDSMGTPSIDEETPSDSGIVKIVKNLLKDHPELWMKFVQEVKMYPGKKGSLPTQVSSALAS